MIQVWLSDDGIVGMMRWVMKDLLFVVGCEIGSRICCVRMCKCPYVFEYLLFRVSTAEVIKYLTVIPTITECSLGSFSFSLHMGTLAYSPYPILHPHTRYITTFHHRSRINPTTVRPWLEVPTIDMTPAGEVSEDLHGNA